MMSYVALIAVAAAIPMGLFLQDTEEKRQQRIDAAKNPKPKGFMMRSPRVNPDIADKATSSPVVIAVTLSVLAIMAAIGS